MTKTINGLTVTTSAAAADFLAIWRASNGDTRKITKANFMGGVLTGGGTIITGGNALTIGGTSSINGSIAGNISGAGTIATGGHTLTVGATSSIAGNISGSGTLATGGFTLTAPATGTASMLGTAQTYSALKDFTSGIKVANGTTLANFVEGTYTPAITGSSSDPTVAYTYREASYQRVGNWVHVTVFIQINTISGGSGNVQVSLPFTAFNGRRARAVAATSTSGVEWTTGTMVTARVGENSAVVTLYYMGDNAALTPIAVGDLATVDIINFSVSYPLA